MADEFTYRRALKAIKELYETIEETDKTYMRALDFLNKNIEKVEDKDLSELVHLISKEAALKKQIVHTTNKIVQKI